MRKPIFSREADAVRVQKGQMSLLNRAGRQIDSGLSSLEERLLKDTAEIDDLYRQAESLAREMGVDTNEAALGGVDFSEIDALLAEVEGGGEEDSLPVIDRVEEVALSDDWDGYMSAIDNYAGKHRIDLSRDCLADLLSPEEKRAIVQKIEDDYKLRGTAHCDKWDYSLAALSGVLAGLIDAFFVGMPGASKLGGWTDSQADKLVEKFAKLVYRNDRGHADAGSVVACREPDGITGSIGFLERRFRVPYDARFPADLQNAEGTVAFSPKNHHLKSISHCPDVVGLFFSILDQFTESVTIVSDGRLYRFKPKGSDGFRLQGKTFCTRICYGVINWLGHVMSDVAGSSGTRGHAGRRGAGIAPPFFEFFQLCNFGNIDVDGDRCTLAGFTTKMYENGYDARFASAQAIPVAINEMLIRLIWSLKRHYYHGLPWTECIPLNLSDKPELRRMLFVGHGCLCLVDAVDAGIRSGGDPLTFALRLNGVAWLRFAHLGFEEIRARFCKDALNTDQMELDLAAGWDALLQESAIG